MLLASSEYRPGVLLNILQCIAPSPESVIWPKMSVVLRLRNPVFWVAKVSSPMG